MMIQNRFRFSSASVFVVCLALAGCERSPHRQSDYSLPDLAAAATPPPPDGNGITTYKIPADDGAVLTFTIKERPDDRLVLPWQRSNWRRVSWQAAGSNVGVTVGYPIMDDLDILSDGEATPEWRRLAYERLTAVEFSTIAVKLARLMGEYSATTTLSGVSYNPTPLERLWDYHVEQERLRPHFAGLMLKILEEVLPGNASRDAEEVERGNFPVGRGRALREIEELLGAGRKLTGLSDSDFAGILMRLDLIALDTRQLNSERRSVLGVLFRHSDPDRYLDLAIQLTEEVKPGWRKGQAFQFCTVSCTAPRFTEANRRRYLRYCYKLLEESDDGRSGNGHFLAGTIASFLELPRVQEERGQRDAFTPDQRLPQYQGPTGLSESFYQDTVNNARKWWSENWARYEPEA